MDCKSYQDFWLVTSCIFSRTLHSPPLMHWESSKLIYTLVLYCYCWIHQSSTLWLSRSLVWFCRISWLIQNRHVCVPSFFCGWIPGLTWRNWNIKCGVILCLLTSSVVFVLKLSLKVYESCRISLFKRCLWGILWY